MSDGQSWLSSFRHLFRPVYFAIFGKTAQFCSNRVQKRKWWSPLKRAHILKIIEMSRKGSGVMVKAGYHPLDIYLGQYILPF